MSDDVTLPPLTAAAAALRRDVDVTPQVARYLGFERFRGVLAAAALGEDEVAHVAATAAAVSAVLAAERARVALEARHVSAVVVDSDSDENNDGDGAVGSGADESSVGSDADGIPESGAFGRSLASGNREIGTDRAYFGSAAPMAAEPQPRGQQGWGHSGPAHVGGATGPNRIPVARPSGDAVTGGGATGAYIAGSQQPLEPDDGPVIARIHASLGAGGAGSTVIVTDASVAAAMAAGIVGAPIGAGATASVAAGAAAVRRGATWLLRRLWRYDANAAAHAAGRAAASTAAVERLRQRVQRRHNGDKLALPSVARTEAAAKRAAVKFDAARARRLAASAESQSDSDGAAAASGPRDGGGAAACRGDQGPPRRREESPPRAHVQRASSMGEPRHGGRQYISSFGLSQDDDDDNDNDAGVHGRKAAPPAAAAPGIVQPFTSISLADVVASATAAAEGRGRTRHADLLRLFYPDIARPTGTRRSQAEAGVNAPVAPTATDGELGTADAILSAILMSGGRSAVFDASDGDYDTDGVPEDAASAGVADRDARAATAQPTHSRSWPPSRSIGRQDGAFQQHAQSNAPGERKRNRRVTCSARDDGSSSEHEACSSEQRQQQQREQAMHALPVSQTAAGSTATAAPSSVAKSVTEASHGAASAGRVRIPAVVPAAAIGAAERLRARMRANFAAAAERDRSTAAAKAASSAVDAATVPAAWGQHRR